MTYRSVLLFVGLGWLAAGSLASAAPDLRIMCYNVDADTNGSGGVGTLASTSALTTVLQAIGQCVSGGQ